MSTEIEVNNCIIKVAFNLDIHVYVYHKYSGTLNTFPHALQKKYSKDLVRINLLSNAQLDTFVHSKVFISFVELSVLHVIK